MNTQVENTITTKHIMVRKTKKNPRLIILLLDTYNTKTDAVTYLDGFPNTSPMVKKFGRYHALNCQSSVYRILPDTPEEKKLTTLLSDDATFISYTIRFSNPNKKQSPAKTVNDLVVQCTPLPKAHELKN